MKLNELAGIGNHNTALFWEYSPQVGRRWNLDPKPRVWESKYSTYGDNPIWRADIFGDEWYEKKNGKAVWRNKPLSDKKMKRKGWTYLGKTAEGTTKDGDPARGNEDGSISVNLFKGVPIDVHAGLGNQKAEEKSAEKRMIEAYQGAFEAGYTPSTNLKYTAAALGVIALPALPFIAVELGATTGGNLLLNALRPRPFNIAAAGTDAINQLSTKDIRDFNVMGTIANGFWRNPLMAAGLSGFINLSYNSFITNRGETVLRAANDKRVWISVVSNTAGNAAGNILSHSYGNFIGSMYGNVIGNELERQTIDMGKKK